MRRTAILVLTLIACGCSKEPPAPPGKPMQEPSTPNLLTNYDLESDTIMGWEYSSGRDEGIITWGEAEADSAVNRSGTRSARLGPIDSKSGESSQTLMQSVEVSTDKIWIDGWVKFEGKKRGGDGRVRAWIQVQFVAGDEVLGNMLAMVLPPGGEFPPDEGMLALTLGKEEKSPWYQLPYHSTEELAVKGLKLAKTPTRVTVILGLEVQGAAEGKAWFDDLVVKEMK